MKLELKDGHCSKSSPKVSNCLLSDDSEEQKVEADHSDREFEVADEEVEQPCSSKHSYKSKKGIKKSDANRNASSGKSSKETNGKNQPDIKSLFAAQMNKNKRKSEHNVSKSCSIVNGTEIETIEHASKKAKTKDTSPVEVEIKPIEGSTPVVKSFKIERCSDCHQILDDKELRMFPGDPGEAVEEFVALTDPRLSLFTGDELEVDEADQRPQHRLTSFSVYDRSTHLCPFDGGLLERNVELYFSGYIKPIYDDNPSTEGGICTRNMGPINEWWTTGFDGGENPVVGFSTAFAEYVLLSPSEAYKPFWDAVADKVQLSKVVIEFLKDAAEKEEMPTYEDLVNRIQITVPRRGASFAGGRLGFTEDSLLRHSQFIVDQILSYDNAAADDEAILVAQPCVRTLVKLTGVVLGRRQGAGSGFKARSSAGKSKTVASKKQDSMACVTPLVRDVFDSMFKGQLEAEDESLGATKRRRCGVCEACQLPDCGKCRSCMDMVKFGGTGRSKQACLARRCPYMMVKEAEEDDILDDAEEAEKDRKRDKSKEDAAEVDVKSSMVHKIGKVSDVKVEWSGEPLTTDINHKIFYSAAVVNEELICLGDHVFVRPDDPSIPMYIAQVRSMWQDSKSGEKLFHARWLNRGSDTILGEASNSKELFLVDDCQDSPLCFVTYGVKVTYIKHHSQEFFAGRYNGFMIKDDDSDDKIFFCQKWYDQEHARFLDFDSLDSVDVVIKENFSSEGKDDNKENVETMEVDESHNPKLIHPDSCCPSCVKVTGRKLSEIPILSEKLTPEDVDQVQNKEGNLFGLISSKNKTFFKELKYRAFNLKVGDCAYFDPDSFQFSIKQAKAQTNLQSKSTGLFGESTYTEIYRKTDYIKGSNEEVPEPFRVAQVLAIYVKTNVFGSDKTFDPKAEDVRFVARKFYRPENTHKGSAASCTVDLNLLYWSEENVVVSLQDFQGKCDVAYFDEADLGLNSVHILNKYFNEGTDRFYFTEAYDPETKKVIEVPREAWSLNHNKGKNKGKGKNKSKNQSEVEEKLAEPLKCLDVFAGCGGLSEGLHQAGIAETKWAIEKDEAAAQAFRLNNSSSVVFTDDCNELLRLAISGATTSHDGQKLPCRGEVDLLCGGPPCQGFSGMNRFNQREYSKFKNSLIASYLSYCDYYRPRYFILENVRNFVSFKRSVVLKLALRCLISMGYQCTFGILQAGCYGVPQTRRRAIILAAAPGYKLPFYPEPVHSFSPRGMQLSVVVDNKKFEGCVDRLSGSAPLRTITVRDAMSDLPHIQNGTGREEAGYSGDAISHFQRLIRPLSSMNAVLLDHICKEMSALVLARMQFIPLVPGSDWRDLPNVEVPLKDGTNSKVLRYTHDDKRAGRSPEGGLRGVCSCAEGKQCDPVYRQFNTLIPWCLPHTGNRHNHWAGLYGRLEWEGFFSTTVTNPEPMGKQGRVLHPEQHRVVSVRECARSQGFPDSYRFYGTILDKHRQVGNAVPPPMARHIGLEIKKALLLSAPQ